MDASKYAAVLYARTEGRAEACVRLVEAKNRISPKEEMSISRLELLAASIGARLWNSKKDVLELRNQEIFFWSDSTTVLTWVKQGKQWNTFVKNRVDEICKLSAKNPWHYVPGNINPADMPLRGCRVQQLIDSRWWEGPDWLKQSKKYWPSIEYVTDEAEVNSEMKKVARLTQKGVLQSDTTVSVVNAYASPEHEG